MNPELRALMDSWLEDDPGAVRARIAGMTRDQIEEILDEAVNELMQAILRAQYAEKAVGALPIGKL